MMTPLWPDRFAERPAIVRMFEQPTIETGVVIRNQVTEPVPTYRYVAPQPKAGPRGGEGDRAKTKAARKANLARRRRKS